MPSKVIQLYTLRCPVSNISKIPNQKSILDKVTQKMLSVIIPFSDTKIILV
jgi:hypothetical protein